MEKNILKLVTLVVEMDSSVVMFAMVTEQLIVVNVVVRVR
jgi:hypothetical protein